MERDETFFSWEKKFMDWIFLSDCSMCALISQSSTASLYAVGESAVVAAGARNHHQIDGWVESLFFTSFLSFLNLFLHRW